MKKFLLLAIGVFSLTVVSCRQDDVISSEDSETLRILQGNKNSDLLDRKTTDSLNARTSTTAGGDPARPPK